MISFRYRRRISPQARLLWAIALVLAFSVVRPALGKVHRDSKRDVKREVEALEEQWRTSQIAGDIPAMDRLLSDDFIGISITGQANTKEQQLDRFRNRRLVLTRIDLSDSKVKLLGSVAIVTSLAEVEGMNEGTSMKGTYRYTRVYQRLPSGIWKTTNFEATRVPGDRRQGPPPGAH
jgi:ketosteroid isomerase-like protein